MKREPKTVLHTGRAGELAAMAAAVATRAGKAVVLLADSIPRLRREQTIGQRSRRGALKGARYVRWKPNRSRNRWATVPDPTPRHQKEREVANWKRSKVGRATLKRRRRPKPTKTLAATIRQGLEEARTLRDDRKTFLRRHNLRDGSCPLCDLELVEYGCRCPF